MKFKLRKKEKREVKRIVEYLVSGGAYFWSGYLMFWFIDKGLGAEFVWAKTISMVFGWTVNYILQRYWVFNNPKLAKHQTEVTGRYIGLSLVNFVIDYFIVLALKDAGLTPYLGQFVAAWFFTVWNYFWYKFYVFPEKYPRAGSRRWNLEGGRWRK
jgi:putative flippase GtrA